MNNYLIISNSNRLTDKKIKEIIDFNNETIYFDLLFNKIEEVLEEASYISLFEDKKNLIVFNADFFCTGKISENDLNIIQSYLNNPNNLTTIVFISKEKPSKKNECYDILKKANKIFDLIKEKVDINSVVNQYCKENKFTISKDAILCLKNNLSNNCDLILAELDKLFLYYGKPCEITLDVVKKNCSNIIEENNFKFVDLVITKNIEESFKYMKELLIMKVEPLSLFNLLVREFRLMLLYKVIDSNKGDFNDLMKTYNLKDWQLDKISRNTYNYKLSELKRIMILLSEYDFKFKTGKVDKNTFLDLLLLEIFEY